MKYTFKKMYMTRIITKNAIAFTTAFFVYANVCQL